MDCRKSLIVLSCFLVASGAQAAEPYHRAASPAEKALDAILTLANTDDDLGFYVRGVPQRDKRKDRHFSTFFTKPLQDAWLKGEKDSLKANCGGKYIEGELCGFDTHPILCAQDVSDTGNLYRTTALTDSSAIITYRWPNASDTIGPYRMIRQGETWVMDGATCLPTMKFNMP